MPLKLWIFTFMLLNYVFTSKFCKILILEGGGDRGAYQAGVMQKMYEILPEEER